MPHAFSQSIDDRCGQWGDRFEAALVPKGARPRSQPHPPPSPEVGAVDFYNDLWPLDGRSVIALIVFLHCCRKSTTRHRHRYAFTGKRCSAATRRPSRIAVPILSLPHTASSHVPAKPRLQQILFFGAVVFLLGHGGACGPRRLLRGERLASGERQRHCAYPDSDETSALHSFTRPL